MLQETDSTQTSGMSSVKSTSLSTISSSKPRQQLSSGIVKNVVRQADGWAGGRLVGCQAYVLVIK